MRRDNDELLCAWICGPLQLRSILSHLAICLRNRRLSVALRYCGHAVALTDALYQSASRFSFELMLAKDPRTYAVTSRVLAFNDCSAQSSFRCGSISPIRPSEQMCARAPTASTPVRAVWPCCGGGVGAETRSSVFTSPQWITRITSPAALSTSATTS